VIPLHVSSHSSGASCKLQYSIYYTLHYFLRYRDGVDNTVERLLPNPNILHCRQHVHAGSET